MFPGNKYLLPAYFSPDPLREKNVPFIKKHAAGREGLNITIQNSDGTEKFNNEKPPSQIEISKDAKIEDAEGAEGAEGTFHDAYLGKPIFQEWKEPVFYSGHTPVISSWVVGENPAGIIIREDKSLVTTRYSNIIPHIVKEGEISSFVELLSSFVPENWQFWRKNDTEQEPVKKFFVDKFAKFLKNSETSVTKTATNTETNTQTNTVTSDTTTTSLASSSVENPIINSTSSNSQLPIHEPSHLQELLKDAYQSSFEPLKKDFSTGITQETVATTQQEKSPNIGPTIFAMGASNTAERRPGETDEEYERRRRRRGG